MNATKPLVSISCLTYNHAKYILEALEGFLMQKTSFPIEILIHDDASTDGTTEIVKDYEEKYPDIIKPKYESENQWNKGIHGSEVFNFPRANGKYIALCEGDDYWTDPLKLQKQVDYLEKSPGFSMCFANSIIIDDEGNVINSSRVPNNYKKSITQKDILNGFVPPTNTMLLKSEHLKSIIPLMGNRILLNSDYFISCLMAEYGEIGYIDDIMAVYRKHAKGIWSSASDYYRNINLFNLFDTLTDCINTENRDLVKSNAVNVGRKLQRENMDDLFLEGNYWTPQTAMLRSIRDLVMKIEGDPINSLSIDTNPSLEKILLRKWPRLQIDYAKYPEHDVQNLHNIQDEFFDIVFSHQVLEHVPKPWLAAKEIV